MNINEIENIIFIEYIVRNEEDEIVGTTVVYKVNGEIFKYETKKYDETCYLLKKFVEQESSKYSTFDDLIKEGKVSRLLIGDILEGNVRPKNIGGYSFPNHDSFIRHRRADKYNKYQGPITWKSPKNSKENNINVFMHNRGRINVRAFLLFLLVSATITLSTIKGVSYIRSRIDTIQTTNYDKNVDEQFINKIINKFINNNEYDIKNEEIDKFVELIEQLYSSNFDLWNGPSVGKSRKRSGVTCNFSNLYNDGTMDKEVLEYFEESYNLYVENYLKSNSSYYEANFNYFCKTLYDLVIKKENFRGTKIKFSDLSPPTQLIILKMFENCADVVDFYTEEYYALSKHHAVIYNNMIMDQIKNKKESAINSMKYIIEISSNIKK